jgi:hypothetical protein
MTMSFYRSLPALAVALWLALPAGTARAAAVYSDTALVQGPEFLTVLSLPLDHIGNYKVTATDLKWFDTPLEGLSFSVGTSAKTLASMDGSGTFEFFKSTSENLYLKIYGHTLGPRFAGLVSITADEVAAVSLPGSLGLLASSLVGVLLLRRGARTRPESARA